VTSSWPRFARFRSRPRQGRGLTSSAAVLVALASLLSILGVDTAEAQRRGRGFYGGDPNEYYVPPDFNGNVPYDGRVTFARIKYRGFYSMGPEGPGWSHDYPRAEEHFMRIIREITSIRPFVENERTIGSNIFALDDPELMKYPVAYLSEPGGWYPDEKEVQGMRNYLLKGGFVIVDDFDEGGGAQLQHFLDVMRQILPKANAVELPKTHPIFDAFFKVDFDLLDGGDRNYGRGKYLAYHVDNDPKKRIMMIVNLNLDIGEFWQYSNRGYNIAPSNEAYKLGVNYLVYALTH
jgi:hypothetical protein